MAALTLVSPGDGMPSSLHTEIAILGAMLLDAVAISDATAKLRAEDFSLDSHQRIYRTILDLLAVNHAVDFLTVQDALSKKRELEAIGGPAYLAYLTEGIPRNLNIESYVRIVKDKSLLRQLMSIFSEGMAQASDQTEEANKLINALERLMTSKMFIDDTPGITLAEMRAKARRLMQQEGRLDLIVIDYLQLMTGSAGSSQKKFENRTQEVSAVSRGLKALAKELRVPVVALSQLSRGSEQRAGDKKPLLSDLRESGSIEQDADVVAFIHREEYYNREDEDLKGKAEIIIAKQRNGPTGSVHLAYISDYTRFENLDMTHGGDSGDAY